MTITVPKAPRAKPEQEEFEFRCFVMPRQGYFVAGCIDLNLFVQAPSPEAAQQKLLDQVQLYVESAIERNWRDLIPRRAGIEYEILWRMASIARTFRHLLGKRPRDKAPFRFAVRGDSPSHLQIAY